MKNGVREIAKLAKVSIGTVSNVMNRPEVVAAETVERVNAAITQLGYQAGSRKKGRRVLAFGDTAQGKAMIEKINQNGLTATEIDLTDENKREKFLQFLLTHKAAAAALIVVTQAGQIAAEFSDFLSQSGNNF